jgi:hypothetical protein
MTTRINIRRFEIMIFVSLAMLTATLTATLVNASLATQIVA